jgi:hypothetical protein
MTMPIDFPEPDWKTLSRLKPLALERLCQRILQESGNILGRVQEGGHHQAYLDLYKHIYSSDEKVANCFNYWKRSRALAMLINWRLERLITDEEFAAFSPETRAIVDMLLNQR